VRPQRPADMQRRAQLRHHNAVIAAAADGHRLGSGGSTGWVHPPGGRRGVRTGHVAPAGTDASAQSRLGTAGSPRSGAAAQQQKRQPVPRKQTWGRSSRCTAEWLGEDVKDEAMQV